MPVGIQQRRSKGWRMPRGARSVARPSRWGNPWRVGDPQPLVLPGGRLIAAESVFKPGAPGRDLPITPFIAKDLFRRSLFAGLLRITVDDVTRELAGWDLACFCAIGSPCYRDVLLEVANA
jgi:hypothetical protein